jgi:glycosyltransferase involved in cell wall biosynthesis
MTLQQTATSPFISIVIPCYNAREHIDACLTSLLAQKTEYRYEIIVVDSSAEDVTPYLQRCYPQVRTVHLPQRAYPGVARNAGIREAGGEVICFSDTDCIIDKSWVQTIGDHIRQGKPVLTGAVYNGTADSYIGTADYLLEMTEFHPSRPRGPMEHIITANVAFSKNVVERIGYLDDTIKGSDRLYAYRMVQNGIPIWFEPNMKVWHKNRTRLQKIFRNAYDCGFGSANVRRMADVSGSLLSRWPILAVGIPFARTFFIARRLARGRFKYILQFLWHYPVILLGLLAYTRGYLANAFTKKK